jgi:acyl-coenzyme A synthetase/AMP-(fatty) acid ligase
MKVRDREHLNAESERRLESMLERIGEMDEDVPWLPVGMSYAALRRMAARLRSGKTRSVNPRMTANELADLIEKSIAQSLLVRSFALETLELNEMERELEQREEEERARHFVSRLHSLKKSPEAADPESPAAQKVRQLNRQIRNELGRPRKRKG